MAPHAEYHSREQDIVRLPAPERPPFSPSPPRLLIIGAGNRGNAYAAAIASSTNGVLVGIVDPIAVKRRLLGRKYIWSKREPREGEEFEDWRDFVAWEVERRERVRSGGEAVGEGVDAVFVCVQDRMHKAVVLGLEKLGVHIMCEKPLATSLDDCVDMYKSVMVGGGEGGERRQKTLFGIGHVLRYSPHNMLLRKLVVEERVIGDVMAVNHTEPVGWWHFTHSYVRGNWRKESTSAPSLLAKSCHDIDILLWLLCSPANSTTTTPPHLPATITSSGSLQYFTKSRKPPQVGNATNCLSCAYEPECQFSAKRIYLGPEMKGRQEHFVSIVLPEIEDIVAASGKQAGETALLSKLGEDYDSSLSTSEVEERNWFGRCVYECDNDVCDNQTVTMTWDDDPATLNGERISERGGGGAKTATLHMVAFTKKICQRFTHIYGVHGEIHADSDTIVVEDFRTGEKRTYWPSVPEGGGHGDGDEGLARQFVLAVDMVKNSGMAVEEAQRVYIGCGVEEILRSHGVVFAAERARKERAVVDFGSWWEREVKGKLGT